jgi:hypothetical protein
VYTYFGRETSKEGPKVRDHWEDLGVGGRITLGYTLGRHGSMWDPVAGFCEHDDEPSGSIKKTGYFLIS